MKDPSSRIEQEIRRLGVADRCELPGGASEAQVSSEMRNADVFVLSSFGEGLPVVLMEAMALKLPIVAPRIAGIPELVEDGESGLLYAPREWDELTSAVQRLLDAPEERERLAASARRTVEQRFDLDQTVVDLLEKFGDSA